jgi:plasmid stabilization system protein ParE
MPDAYRIRITPRALANLEGIFDFIQRDSPQNAREMIRRLLDSIDDLRMLPYRYAVPRTGAARSRAIRSMPVRPYLVRYRIDENRKAVFILRIRHGARRRP